MDQKQKSIKTWVILLFLPYVLIFGFALLQFLVRAIFNTQSLNSRGTFGSGTEILNIITLIAGIIGALLLLLTPLWLVFIVRDLKGHDRNKTVAVILAVLFGYFTWLYTWDEDSNKFLICLALSFLTFGFGSIIAWIWAIVDSAIKPNEFFLYYNQPAAGASPNAPQSIFPLSN